MIEQESSTSKYTDHGNKPADEFEIMEVIRIDVRRRVDLKAVVVLVGVLEQTVHGIKHFV